MKKKILIILTITLISSQNKQKENNNTQHTIQITSDTKNLQVTYTENTKIKSKIHTKRMIEYQNKNTTYPEGIQIEIYDQNSTPSSTITANTVKYFHQEKLYQLTGNVIFTNKKKKETIHTQKLYWDYKEKKIYTDKTVQIKTQDITLSGIGLEANQEFTYYKIINPKGIINKKTNDKLS